MSADAETLACNIFMRSLTRLYLGLLHPIYPGLKMQLSRLHDLSIQKNRYYDRTNQLKELASIFFN
jgi:hypothetical protein